jgi:hypothetical protein
MAAAAVASGVINMYSIICLLALFTAGKFYVSTTVSGMFVNCAHYARFLTLSGVCSVSEISLLLKHDSSKCKRKVSCKQHLK